MNSIYNLNNGKIEIYDINPLKDKILLFKKKEMNKINENERVLDYCLKEVFFKNNMIYEDEKAVIKKTKYQKNKDYISKVLYGDSYQGQINRFKRPNKRDLILLDIQLNDIKKIQLTEDLCNELLIEKEKYDSKCINLEIVGNLKDLFEISNQPKTIIDLEEIKKYYNTDLIDEDIIDFNEKLNYLENSSKIYKKLK